MANTIRDAAGLKYLETQNSRFARLPAASVFAGNTWTTIRVALLMDVTTTANIVGTEFYVGLCSGTSNIPGDATPTNAIGIASSAVTGLGYVGTATAEQVYADWLPTKDVGGVRTIGAAYTASFAINTTNNTNADGPSSCFFVTITKGAPNYSLQMFTVSALSSAGMTSAQFHVLSAILTPAKTGFANSAVRTLAFDQTAGTLDAAFVYWQPGVLARILDWRVIKLA